MINLTMCRFLIVKSCKIKLTNAFALYDFYFLHEKNNILNVAGDDGLTMKSSREEKLK